MDESEITRLVLIPAGPSSWEGEARLVGSADIPIAPESRDLVNRWGEQLKPSGLNLIFSSPGGPAHETARILAGILRIRHRVEKDLAEVNLGLWQGLFLEEVRHRHPKVYRQWVEQPDCVTPPEGERLASAGARVEGCIGRILKKYQGHKVGVVLGPLALALARTVREGRALRDFWALVKEPLTWHEYVVKCNGVSVT